MLNATTAQGFVTVTTIERIGTANLLLATLGPEPAAAITPLLHRRFLNRGAMLRGEDAAAELWFPETLVAVMQERMRDGSAVDVAVIGREGMVGWPALLGEEATAHRATVLLDGGSALVAEADAVVALCAEHAGLRAALLAFVQSQVVQMAQSIASARRDGVEARLARLLLMLHDRIDGDDMPITHVELSASMQVRRASVTDCLHVLEGEGILRCTRGRLIVRDRDKLRHLANGSYGPAEAAYTRLVGPFGRG